MHVVIHPSIHPSVHPAIHPSTYLSQMHVKNKNIPNLKNQTIHTHHAPPIIQLTVLAVSHTPILPLSTQPRTHKTPHSHSHSQVLRRKPQPRPSRRIIKHHKLRLEEDIPKDRLADPAVALQAPEAAPGFGRGGVVHVIARRDRVVRLDAEREVRQGRGAGEDVAAVGLAVGGARDLGVVGGDDVVGQEEEGGARVGDGGEAVGSGGRRADGVAAGREAPEALAVVHGRVGDVARVLAVVDVAEVVATRLALAQIGREERGVEAGLGVGEEGPLLVRPDGVDGAEGEPEEAIALVLGEFRTDGPGQFDGLAGHGGAADADHIGVDVSTGGAAVSVANAPSFAPADRGGTRVGWVVNAMASLLVPGQLGGEDPSGNISKGRKLTTTSNVQIRRSSVEIQVQSLATNSDGFKVSLVILLRIGRDRAVIRPRSP